MRKPELRILLPEQARLRMADLCSRSEHCRADIRERLVRHGLSSGDIESILDFLTERGFISDQRFARAFVSDKVRFNSWGKLRIVRELAMKRVDPEAVREAIEGIDEEQYIESAMRAGSRKARSLDLHTRDGRMRLYRHLASKGYESAVISIVISRLAAEEE